MINLQSIMLQSLPVNISAICRGTVGQVTSLTHQNINPLPILDILGQMIDLVK